MDPLPVSGARRTLPLFAAALLAAVGACGRRPPLVPTEPVEAASPTAPDSFLVLLETTRGPVTILARRPWSPLGVDRFHDLVRRGFYDGVTVFRVVEGYVAQFGHTDSASVNQAWGARPLDDEPVVARNTRGRVAFARSGPNTRTYQLFVNLGENSPRLDTLAANGVVGYPPIGEVVEGMDAVETFESRYGNEPSARQDSIRARGGAYLDTAFPGLDRILEARVVQRWE